MSLSLKPKHENEEDVAEDIAKTIEVYKVYSFFFNFFASNFFGSRYFYRFVQISSLFLLLSLALFLIVRERDEVIK